MVRIDTKIERDLVSRGLQDGREIVFEIAWENNGSYYPMKPWEDFGMLLLGWWSAEISSLAKGERDKIKLSFMDGPYALFLTINRNTQEVIISSENGEFEATSSLDDIKKQMTATIHSIKQEILNIDENSNKEQKHLDECLKLIG
jgi:hypothetical protein